MLRFTSFQQLGQTVQEQVHLKFSQILQFVRERPLRIEHTHFSLKLHIQAHDLVRLNLLVLLLIIIRVLITAKLPLLLEV